MLSNWNFKEKGISFLFFFFLLSFYSVSQIKQESRYENFLSKDESGFEVVSDGPQGLFFIRNAFSESTHLIEIQYVDSAFKMQWNGFVQIKEGVSLIGKKSNDQFLFLLFKYNNVQNKDLLLYKIYKGNGDYLIVPVKNFVRFYPVNFQITKSAILVGGYFNQVPLVLFIDPDSGTSRVLPGLFNEMGELNQILIHDDGTFDVLIRSRNYYKQQTIWVKSYSEDGFLNYQFTLDPGEKKELLFGRSIMGKNNLRIVAGVYSRRRSEFSRGLFMATIDSQGTQQIKYFNYSELKNFFSYLKPRKQIRIHSRIDRRKIKEKNIIFNYRVLVHDLMYYKNQFILLGEAFYPHYSSFDRNMYSGIFTPYLNAGSWVRDGRIFDGFYYTHAVVVGFNEAGDILWDNCFEMNDVKTFSLDQYVKVEMDNEKMKLIYLFQDQFQTKIIKGNAVVEEKTGTPIQTRLESDIIPGKGKNGGNLEYWYGDYFYATGVQEIYNPTENQVPVHRKVFFVTKLKVK